MRSRPVSSSPSPRRPAGARALFLPGAVWLGLLVGCGDAVVPPATPPPVPPAEVRAAAPEATPVAEGAVVPSPTSTPPRAVRTPARDAAPPPVVSAGATTRWYEMRRQGQKLGWIRVVWAPSTWQGHPTIHDTTTVRTRESRDMAGTEDVFANESTTDVERGEDGTLWWQRTVAIEADRTITEETTWTGEGYRTVARLGETEQVHVVKTSTPAHVDSEAFLGRRIAAGEVHPGDKFVLRALQPAAERVHELPVEVLAPEPAQPDGPPLTRLRETDPESGGETHLWLDAEGVVVRVKAPLTEILRVSEETALERPARPASFSITTPATPSLPRVFSADRLEVDVHVRPDPDRPRPEFPTSPWSRVLETTGDEASGWITRVELKAYDVPGATTAFPVKDPAFAKDLEPTLLMPCGHPDVVAAAREAVGDAKEAREAVVRIAEFVFALEKQSTAVAQASALEILAERQGDCSEHALLFVALCRAAGIPARRCSGFVCVGTDWGAHAWAEVWVGAWIGVDPTTNDVGTAARYLFYGYDDAPSSRLGTVSVRSRGRLRLVTRLVEEGADRYELGDATTWRSWDPATGRAIHRLAGLDLRGVPSDARVTLAGDGDVVVRLPEGTATVHVRADQGHRSMNALRQMAPPGSEATTFGGAPALRIDAGPGRRMFVVASRKRHVIVDLRAKASALDAFQARFEPLLAPSLTPRPTAP